MLVIRQNITKQIKFCKKTDGIILIQLNLISQIKRCLLFDVIIIQLT